MCGSTLSAGTRSDLMWGSSSHHYRDRATTQTSRPIITQAYRFKTHATQRENLCAYMARSCKSFLIELLTSSSLASRACQ